MLGSMLAVRDETVLATAVEKVEAVPISMEDGALVTIAAVDETADDAALLVMGTDEVADESVLLTAGAVDEAADADAEEPLTAPPGPETRVVKSPLST
jgi:hypothetical protein